MLSGGEAQITGTTGEKGVVFRDLLSRIFKTLRKNDTVEVGEYVMKENWHGAHVQRR